MQRARKQRAAQTINEAKQAKVRQSEGVTIPHSHALGQACTVRVRVMPETTGRALAKPNPPPPLDPPPTLKVVREWEGVGVWPDATPPLWRVLCTIFILRHNIEIHIL